MMIQNMKMRTKIKDLFSISDVMLSADTIFKFLKNSSDYPLLADFIKETNYETLDADYYLTNSADKYISPLIERLIEHYDTMPSPYKRLHTVQYHINVNLAKIVYSRFGVKWKKLYDALNVDYEPLENYAMEETRTPNLTDSETSSAKTNIDTNRTTNATNKYAGFNSEEPTTVSVTDGSDDTVVSGECANNEVSKTNTHTGTETLTRHGNIGVTTSQQMLESEFKVREYDFYKKIYKDIDSLECLSIY